MVPLLDYFGYLTTCQLTFNTVTKNNRIVRVNETAIRSDHQKLSNAQKLVGRKGAKVFDDFIDGDYAGSSSIACAASAARLIVGICISTYSAVSAVVHSSDLSDHLVWPLLIITA